MTIEGGTMDGKLKISDTLSLPYEAVTETFAILAKRGKGKTYAASVMAEEMIAAGMPVVVIDPLGVWWGLRSSADGKSDGLPVVIFGGEHADVPLDEGSGSMIADVIVDQRFSAIVDLLLLSKAARRRFMAAFLERLYFLNREALHVFVDEADMFAPQSTGGAENAHVLGAMEDMVRRGRSRGIGVTMITQRPAVLNKDVLTQAEVLIAMGMNGLRDVKAIDEWVRLHADEATAVEVKKSLPSLPVGTAWVWSPGLLDVLEKVKIRRRHTFDSSSTPKIGQVRQVPKTMAEIDVAALGEKIAATVERAKADDPRELKKRIRDMERELADALAKPPAVAEVEVPVVPDSLADRIKGVAEIMTRAAVTTEEIYEWLSSEGFQQKMRDISVPPVRAAPARPEPKAFTGTVTTYAGEDVHLRKGARRMVESLGRMYPLRLTTSQWGTVARLKTSGGTWSTYLSDIRKAGFVDESADGWQLTDAGFDYLGGQPAPMTAEELQQHYRSILRDGAKRMLDVLMKSYPAWISTEELSERAALTVTGGTWSTYLSDLTRNGLAEKSGHQIRATDILMNGAAA
jgi:hypothetical protein